MIKISPSLLSADWMDLGKELERLHEWGADMVHCDVIDGLFAPNITFGMPMISALKRKSKLPLDVHLMIVEPERYIDKFISAGSDTIAFHPEASKKPHEVLEKIRSKGIKAGIALNPDVPVRVAEEFLGEIDYILLMGVFPGFGGQKFIPEVMDKIDESKQLIASRDIYVELDGGVTTENIVEMKKRGLDAAVAGNAVFAASDPAAAIVALKA
ncbi:MAG TPA: ribulose-phosphate 3-epimerase [Candidatus Caccalectryoclostridium excrementigallinarum]|uniref:Ribulose-phosphate 3-epimerase n=1 Tax=Candidatus Caccalectryoclostridium excrementigallinarum TaxID=2840710 RepID=A0A9D1SK64_9FIRM|nr:ribulose-phosphate 3-epimerase [Candidatus Caccalectryoclostridium excrementigallinarum]